MELQRGLFLAVLGVLTAPAQANEASLERCLQALKPKAAAGGVSAATFDRYTQGLALDPTVLDALDAQPEFVTPIWDYLAGLVDAERIADGRRLMREHAATLADVSKQYRVDAETIVAVWGVESDFGRIFGKRPLLTSLATLSCAGRRQDYFRAEFFATLKILQSGDVREEDLRGSWAGAFGQTQFMPTTFLRLAVDFDRDGRRDLVGSEPDALASTANYLAKAGWKYGEPWGFEVSVPDGFDARNIGRKTRKPLSHWAAKGVKRVDGAALAGADAPADRNAALLLPAGARGPAFIVFRNYDAIFSYNAAESYSLAIALLSDQLRGKRALVAKWPTDDPGLSRAERRELQTLLQARGHEIGEIDGMIGKLSREAIQREQKRLGLEPDGRAGRKILAALRK
jgi:glucose-6-phosphate 1-epimerase